MLELIADRMRLPVEAAHASLGQSIGDVARSPNDTPAELAELLCDMLDPLPENRPVAAVGTINQTSRSRPDSATRFRHANLHGNRKAEMASPAVGPKRGLQPTQAAPYRR